MSSTLDESLDQANETASEKLRTTMAAMRLSFTWFGTRKTLSPQQKSQAADTFHAEGKFISAGKKLIDTGAPAFRAVTSIRSRAVAYFKGVSLPYPEPGIRLVPQGSLDHIAIAMQSFHDELQQAVVDLDEQFSQLKYEARDRLGDLYCDADYPDTMSGLFEIAWDFPSVEPPEYLRRLNPQLYQQECDRMRGRFDEAVQLAEGAFLDELSKLVDHLSERIAGSDDGKPKVFRDSAIENLTGFFERFQRLNISSSDELDQLVDRARAAMRGVKPDQLRGDAAFRQEIAGKLSGVQSSLDGLLVDRPRRSLIRRAK